MQRRIEEIMDTGYLLVYLLGSLAVLGVQYGLARSVSKKGRAASAYVAMGSACSNSGYVGYPVMLQYLGPVAAVAMALCMLVENLIILPLLLFLADREAAKSGGWHTLKLSLAGLLRNPLFIAIVLGFGCALLHIRMPDVISRTVGLFSLASTALSLFVIGGMLVGLQVRGLLPRVSVVVVGKLVGHPLAVFLMLTLLTALWPAMTPQNPQLRTAVVAFAAMPMMGIYPILAMRHKQEGFAAAALLVTTIASFFSLSLILWLLKHFPV
jgi:malonate transporter